jgi:hypothetical protein
MQTIHAPAGLTIFRPDSRNGSKDFFIDREQAKKLFAEGVIYGDATNGGYMPSPKTPHNFKALYQVVPKKRKSR